MSAASGRAWAVRLASLLGLSLLWLWAAASDTASQTSLIPPSYSSSALAVTRDGALLLVVNPDSKSLTLVDTAAQVVRAEVPVGIDPRAVAVSADGAWACTADQGSDTVSVVDLTTHAVTRTMSVGDRPVGVAVAPDGRRAAVAELGDDRVRLLDTSTWTTWRTFAVADRPYGLAFTPDGRRLLVTHLLSGQVTLLSLDTQSIYLPLLLRGAGVPLPGSGAASAPGRAQTAAHTVIDTWPNVAPAPSVIVSSSGTRAYLPQTMAHGLGMNVQFDNTVFPKVSVLNLSSLTHETAEHISLPEQDQPVGLPWAAALARGDQELWVVNAGSNDVSVLDIRDPRRVRRSAHVLVGDNPRGIVLSPDGHTAYVNNILAGTVSVVDTDTYGVTATIQVTRIPLPPVLLTGKRLFHSSARPELAQARWIACNTCHIEGEQDGRTWLLQYTGEVPVGAQAVITRNTTSLLGMIETYPLRWSAEWDESADSEFSIRFEQFGTGLVAGQMNPTLGEPNQGRSYELDCLATFIDSLSVPEGNPPLGEAERRGQVLFDAPRTGCLTCHPPPLYTDLQVHDVGTASSYGEWFGPLIDTPTLRFLYDSAPYLHDGSAATLREVLTIRNAGDEHGVTSHLSEDELADMIAFLLSLPNDEPGGMSDEP